jgi:hypothetical protein
LDCGSEKFAGSSLSVTLTYILQIVENKRPGEMSEPFDVSSIMADIFEGRGNHIAVPGIMWSGAVRSASPDGIIKQRQGIEKLGRFSGAAEER